MIKIVSPIFDDVFLIYEKNWKLKNKDEYIDLDVTVFKVLMLLHPYLKQKKSFYIDLINSHNIEAISSFPSKQIIESGLILGTRYWVKFAIEWLNEENDYTLNVYFSTYLNGVINDKNNEQKTRQMAEKLLNRLND